MLLREEQYEHKYPYDWRTKKPTIFRCSVRPSMGLQRLDGHCRVVMLTAWERSRGNYGLVEQDAVMYVWLF